MKIRKSKENEQWKGLRSVSLYDNIETSALVKQRDFERRTANAVEYASVYVQGTVPEYA
jgi:hypothetical protein